jgi:hypothetical protein
MFSPRFLCAEYTPIPYTGMPTARLSRLAHSAKVSSEWKIPARGYPVRLSAQSLSTPQAL